MTTTYRVAAITVPRLEPLVIQELKELLAGCGTPVPTIVRSWPGVVEFTATPEQLWTVAHGARVAEGLRVRLGKPAAVRNWRELEAEVTRLPLAAFLPKSVAPRVLATTGSNSVLYHSGAIQERVAAAIATRLGCPAPAPATAPSNSATKPTASDDAVEDRDPAANTPAVFVRVHHNQLTVSVDASGARLHKRGYKQAVTAAPLRETLGAAVVRLALQQPFAAGCCMVWDPFCGSGTLVFEAHDAWVGGSLGPLSRTFHFQLWPTHDSKAYAAFLHKYQVRAAARGATARATAPVVPTFLGSDLAARALHACSSNLQRYRELLADPHLSPLIRFQRGDVTEVGARLAGSRVLVISNLPYGHRTDARDDALARFGAMLRGGPAGKFAGAVVLSGVSATKLEQETGVTWSLLQELDNGGMKVPLLAWQPAVQQP